MADSMPNSRPQGCTSFRKVADAFLTGDGLPFADVLSAERIERVFAKHDSLFGERGLYTTAVVVWAFLSQLLRDGKEASCQSAVAHVVSYYEQQGRKGPTADTGDYCHARRKLSEPAIHELSNEIAAEVEKATDPAWLWKGKYHAKVVDGSTFTMPDTPANQAAYPQPNSQKRGVGLPIARLVAILSLATACAMDLAVGPYKGKETGETALLRSMLSNFGPDDVAVMDRYYCSYWILAMLWGRGTHVCARKHHLRKSDFRRGKRLGKYDHVIIWRRPKRPDWMDEATYAKIPETLQLREIRFNVVEPGRRTQTFDVITTLTDADEFSKEDIAQLYGFRWNSELDLRSIKSNLNLSHVRCKSPEMVRRELWMTILGYNLIRTTAAGAAALHGKQPRQISFTSTCQYVLASWMQLSTSSISAAVLDEYLYRMLHDIAHCEVANRPGRLEPRVLKRRRHGYPLMQKPREELRAELRAQCT